MPSIVFPARRFRSGQGSRRRTSGTGRASRQIAALARAREEAQSAYEGGVLPLIEVLDADRDLLAARDQLATANANEARAAVASFRELGGGRTD